MKKSEEIKAEIDRLEAEYDAKVKAVVFDTFGEDTPEEHDQKWEAFYEGEGKKLTDRFRLLEEEYRKELNREIEVGDGVTVVLWSDREAYTVIGRTKTTLTIQRDKATRHPDFVPEYVTGGFSAICVNDADQKWILERDPDGRIEKAHWSEKYGMWQLRGQVKVVRGRREHYDHNF